MPRAVHRMPRPRGSALGRAPRAPRVAYRLVAEPRVVPRVLPRVGAEYFDVGLEETVLGGCSTKEVSVVLGTVNGHVLARLALLIEWSSLTGRSSRHRLQAEVVLFLLLFPSVSRTPPEETPSTTERGASIPFWASACLALLNESAIGACSDRLASTQRLARRVSIIPLGNRRRTRSYSSRTGN